MSFNDLLDNDAAFENSVNDIGMQLRDVIVEMLMGHVEKHPVDAELRTEVWKLEMWLGEMWMEPKGGWHPDTDVVYRPSYFDE